MIKFPGKKIRMLRELKSYSQEYIADSLGLSIRAYSKIESGETKLTIDRLNEISRILEISSYDILNFDLNTFLSNLSKSSEPQCPIITNAKGCGRYNCKDRIK